MNSSNTNNIPEQEKGQGPFSSEVPELLEHHLEHLKASAISVDVVRDRGYQSVLGKARVPGILIPLHGPDGTIDSSAETIDR